MQAPYHSAAQETKRQAAAPIKTGAAIGGALIAGSAIFKKVIPFLSPLIPGELMRKGLSKIKPGIGKIIDTAINNGYSLDDIRNFMTEKFDQNNIPKNNEETNQENPVMKQAKDFETNYPDIVNALMGYINNG